MRIFVIGRDFPSVENRMLGSFEFEQARLLSGHGHEVYYPYVDLRSIRHRRRLGTVITKKDGVNVVAFNIPIGFALPARIRLKAYSKLRKNLIKNISNRFGVPDIVSIHYPSIYPYDYFSTLQRKGAKIIGLEHWSKVQNRDLPEVNLRYLKEFVNYADAVMCVSFNLKESIIQLTGTTREIAVVPNIVSKCFEYKNVSKSGDSFHFLAVGRLSQEKGYDKLVCAFNKAFKHFENIKLHLVGGGYMYDDIKKSINDFNAENTIIMHGVLNQPELADLYRQCNALIMPSEYETFGVPAAEAMSCGLPVIVTRNTGIANYVSDKCGIVIENNDINLISDAMISLYRNISKYNSDKISEFANKSFSESVIYQKIMNVFNNCIEGVK